MAALLPRRVEEPQQAALAFVGSAGVDQHPAPIAAQAEPRAATRDRAATWFHSGDVPLDESGELKVSQTSYDCTRPYWDQIGATVVGRHVFDMTDGWDGKPPGRVDHVVVVTHRPERYRVRR